MYCVKEMKQKRFTNYHKNYGMDMFGISIAITSWVYIKCYVDPLKIRAMRIKIHIIELIYIETRTISFLLDQIILDIIAKRN